MQCPGVAGTAPGRLERWREERRWRGGCARLAGSTLLPSPAYRGPVARVAGIGRSPLHEGALSHGVPTSNSSTARSRRPSQSQSRSDGRRNIRSKRTRGRGRNGLRKAGALDGAVGHGWRPTREPMRKAGPQRALSSYRPATSARTRCKTASTNSVVPAWPPRSSVRTPAPTVFRAAA
jgi:hypothetical protein